VHQKTAKQKTAEYPLPSLTLSAREQLKQVLLNGVNQILFENWPVYLAPGQVEHGVIVLNDGLMIDPEEHLVLLRVGTRVTSQTTARYAGRIKGVSPAIPVRLVRKIDNYEKDDTIGEIVAFILSYLTGAPLAVIRLPGAFAVIPVDQEWIAVSDLPRVTPARLTVASVP